MALYIGYLAAIIGTICWIPQAYKAWASRETSGLSLLSNLKRFAFNPGLQIG